MKMNVLAMIVILTGAQISVFAKNEQMEAIPKNVQLKVSEMDVKILDRAINILSSDKVWNRRDTRDCSRHDVKWSLYCSLVKASMELKGEFDHRGAAIVETRRTVEDVSKNKKYEHRLMGYNNDPTTSFEDVKNILKLTKDRITKRLKDK